MYVVGVTDQSWFEFLRSEGITNRVNFWTPTPWNPRRIQPGDEWLFLLHSPIRKIAGFGIFQQSSALTVESSWNTFGKGNGVSSMNELLSKTRDYSERNSLYPVVSNASIIGSIELNDVQFFSDDNFRDLNQLKIEFGIQNLRFKYFPGSPLI